jgi:hypothetical protein
LIVRGLNDIIYYGTWDDLDWDGWTALANGATCDGIGVAATGDALSVVVRGMDV